MERPKTEPSSTTRQAAAELWQLFVALCDEGFTERQALVVIGQTLTAGIARGGDES